MGPGDESKAYGVDGDASNVRQQHAIDWLEQASDLPHLIARVSELVLRLGYGPDELVILPRAELDRRELAAYSAGWADVVDEQLPAVRRAYEERITAAYLQGQEDARTGRRPRRATRRAEGEREHERASGDERGGDVIPLPYVELLRPPSELTRVEQRGERERSVADGTPVPMPPADPADPAELAEHDDDEAGGVGAAEAGSRADGEILLSAREVRERVPPSERRPVVRRNGRPSVPPLALPGDIGAAGRERGRRQSEEPSPPGPPDARDEVRPRLSDKARALADELEGRVGGRHRDEENGPSGSGSG
ncbi:hypothetical protein [Streptomyces sp. NPDC050263]|uniref:hypothetical protein n=1 Tax=Streptomyces sp. NPDC050263 TaxID=3155037 RepID=UPI00344305BB